jgi:hypothetical protein
VSISIDSPGRRHEQRRLSALDVDEVDLERFCALGGRRNQRGQERDEEQEAFHPAHFTAKARKARERANAGREDSV